MMNEVPLFAVDVGNTRTKVGFWAKPDYRSFVEGRLSVPACDDGTTDSSPVCDGVLEWLQGVQEVDERPGLWLISSVNGQKTDELERRVATARPQDFFVKLSLRDIPIRVDYDDPTKLGLDRAIAAYSAVNLLECGTPFLVVDVGTAATIDYVDAQGSFRGGAILPGARLIAESLNANTSQLPLLADPENWVTSRRCERDGKDIFVYPATETQSAIRLGIVYTLVGSVMSFFWTIRRRIILENGNPNRLSIVLSGGDAEMTKSSLLEGFSELSDNLGTNVPIPPIYVETRLVLNGLFRIAAGTSCVRMTK